MIHIEERPAHASHVNFILISYSLVLMKESVAGNEVHIINESDEIARLGPCCRFLCTTQLNAQPNNHGPRPNLPHHVIFHPSHSTTTASSS